jgi:protoheme IX farnesyltransferase
MAAGAANTFNMLYERDLDVAMERTSHRPTVTHALTNAQALVFGLALAVGSFAILWLGFNLLAAMMAMAGLLFYFFVYTMALKRRTSQNIVIGGAAGAFPPLVGYAAVTGTLDPIAWYLFAIIFLWTPVHFWALALLIKDDYARAGVPMLPVVKGKPHTRFQILLYTLVLVPLGVLPAALHIGGVLYLAASAGVGLWFLWEAIATYGETDETKEPAAHRLFGVSLLYLAALFAALIIEKLAGIPPLSLTVGS